MGPGAPVCVIQLMMNVSFYTLHIVSMLITAKKPLDYIIFVFSFPELFSQSFNADVCIRLFHVSLSCVMIVIIPEKTG